MNYSYEIERISTKHRYMRVRYFADGREDIRQTFNPTEFTQSALDALIAERAKNVVLEWDAQETSGTDTEETLSLTLTGNDTIPAPTPEEEVETAVALAASDRYAKESSGILWSKDGSTFYLDTTIDSQNRFSAARIAVEAGERVDGSVWKLADVTSGSPVLTFRPTTNAEVAEMAGLVHDFVQKCFQAEANTVQKIFGGDLTASFEAEFNAL